MAAETLRVLLVDDDPDTLPLTRGLLAQRSNTAYELEWADTYERGRDVLCSGRHDVCLLDYRLGTRDGLDLLREAVRAGCRVPVIMLTGQSGDSLDVQALQSGATDYLAKADVTGPGLERSIRYAIERHRGEEERRRALDELKALTSQVSAGLWSTDLELRIVSSWGRGLLGVNGAAASALGRTVREMADQADFLAAHERALRGESVSLEVEQHKRIFQVHLAPRMGLHAETLGVVGVGLDVTDHRHVEAEFEAARAIQRGLLPLQAPRADGLDIAGVCRPAQATGGDYFDFISLPHDSLAVVIADVSRHGFASALIMVETRRLIRSLLADHVDLGCAMMAANRAMVEDTPLESFVTLFAARMDVESRTLTYSGAGHEGYVIHPGGAMSRLPSTTLPLGIDPDAAMTVSDSVPLEPGEMLLLTTDGMYEVMSPDGELFGLERVWRSVHGHRQRKADEILENLMDEARRFAGEEPLHDDMTAVLIKVE